MRLLRFSHTLLLLSAVWLLLAACGGASSTPAPRTIETAPAPTAENPSLPQPTPAPTLDVAALYDGEWKPIGAGLEQMSVRGKVGEAEELLTLVRIDPAQFSFEVRYEPQAPLNVRDWVRAANGEVVINGGFFDEQNAATALLIVDQEIIGQSYKGFGGMFSVRRVNNQDSLTLQWLRTQPYAFSPNTIYALQSFPMLMTNGRANETIDDNGKKSRRSFVALDTRGRVVLGVCQFAQWSLTELAQYLDQANDLQLVSALNLDGGGSAGLWVRNGIEATLMDSLDRVPMVIVVKRRT